MKFRLGPMLSDILISIYVVVSLYFRFKLESQYPVSPLYSVVMGLCFVTILWVLIKLKVLNPRWFGLFNPKVKKS
ncbi:MAG: hypothetical protein OIF50_12380 [Flavobacteriaceae bacterium]|nr:hypothetical protein [Flavobacteriaceae bacterium]